MTAAEQGRQALARLTDLARDRAELEAALRYAVATESSGGPLREIRLRLAQNGLIAEFWQTVARYCNREIDAAEMRAAQARIAGELDRLNAAGAAPMPDFTLQSGLQ